MNTAKDVAQFFIAKALEQEDDGISNMKLQKLLYYAKGFHQAINGESLFPEKIEAWTHGPVVPEMYHEYKNFGKEAITAVEYTPNLAEEKKELLNEVWDVFGQYSAWKLRDMTHNESPWLTHESDATVIEDEELEQYFKTRLK